MPVRKPIFIIPLELGTITTGNEIAGKPAANLNRKKAISLTWKSSGTANLWARGDFGSAKSIDFMSLVSANALAGTTIRLRLGATQAAVDGVAGYDSTALAFISPSIADGVPVHSHLEIGSVQSYRWWRIDIAGHTGDFEASTLVLGKTIEPSRYYNIGFERGIRDLGSLSFSRFGVFDEEDGAIFRTLNFTLAWQTEAEIETSFLPMAEALGSRGVVFVCFDPQAAAYRQSKTYLGVMDKPPFATGTKKAATYSQEFQIVSMI